MFDRYDFARRSSVWEFFTNVWEIFTNVWENFTNVWEILTNVWEIFTNVWEISTNIWEILTNVWEILTNVWEIFTNVWEFFTNVWEIYTMVFVRRNLPGCSIVNFSQTIIMWNSIRSLLKLRTTWVNDCPALLLKTNNMKDEFDYEYEIDYRTEENEMVEIYNWLTIDWYDFVLGLGINFSLKYGKLFLRLLTFKIRTCTSRPHLCGRNCFRVIRDLSDYIRVS